MSGVAAHSGRPYAKPVVVPEDLHMLIGPTGGGVMLPRHLKWSGNARYDLDMPGRIMDMYRTVINEAASVDDLNRYLNEAVLRSLWQTMWLPPPLRAAWEHRFPELASTVASTSAI